MKSLLVTLHGFLGLPEDWQFLKKLEIEVEAVNVHNDRQVGLWDWARCFNKHHEGKSNKILLGYSMGGRLALHALLEQPEAWQAGVIVSAHPGLSDERQKEMRILCDKRWAERFENEPWEQLVQAWEGQEIFKNDLFRFQREESRFNRKELSHALSEWSLGRQENLLERLSEIPVPVLWIAGELDTRYAALANTIKLKHAKSKVWIAPNVGHRVPWADPVSFLRHLQNFLEGVAHNE